MPRRPRKPEGWPVWRPLGVVAIIGVTAFLLIYCLAGDTETVDAEARYAGVHLCTPKEAVSFTPSSTPTSTFTPSPTPELSATAPASGTAGAGSPLPGATEDAGAPAPGAQTPSGTPPESGADGDASSPTPPPSAPTPTPPADDIAGVLGDEAGETAPFFSQRARSWGENEYDHGNQQDVGCGTTIAQCGCAMTSLGTVLSLFDVVNGADGQPLNPGTLNDWMNQDSQLTDAGWASRGFVLGNVVWTVANAYSAESAAARGAGNTVRFARWGTGSYEEIRADLDQGRPVILEVPGHYIAAVGLDGDEILINDPYYRDRTRLSEAYPGLVRSSRHFEASSDLSALIVTVPANLRVIVRDSQGRVTGTLGGDSPDDAQNSALGQIPGSAYRFEEAWRDPTCSETPPAPGAGTNTIFIAEPGNQTFEIEVVSPDDDKPAEIVIHDVDKDGQVTVETVEAPATTGGDDDGGRRRVRVAHDTPEKGGGKPGTKVLLPGEDAFALGTPVSITPTGDSPTPETSVTATPDASPTVPPTATPATPTVVPPTLVPPTATPPAPPSGGFDPACTDRWFALNNEFRTSRALPALGFDTRLASAAREYAAFVLARRWWDNHGPGQLFGGVFVDGIHIDDRGRDHFIRATSYGFPEVDIGENVAWGTLGLSEAQIMYDYLIPGAHEPIEDPAWAFMGVACYKDGTFQAAVIVYGSAS